MEKWIAVALVACVAGCAKMETKDSVTACAPCAQIAPVAETVKAPAERTLADFLAAAKVNSEKKGVAFNEARATSRFSAMDLDGDGVLTQADRDAAQAATKEAGQ
jgi:uncharacterized protein YcfJ